MLNLQNPLAPIVVGGGFVITINSGIVIVGTTPITVPQTVLNLTASATNYIFISSSGTLTINTTGFVAGCLPIATITTNSLGITSITDNRPDFNVPPSGGTASSFAAWGGLIGSVSSTVLSASNKIQLSGVLIPTNVSFSNIVLSVVGTDAVNSYDFGLYDSSGNLKCHIGAQSLPSSGIINFTVAGGASLVAGQYYSAFTGNGTTCKITTPGGGTQVLMGTILAITESVTSSVGGALPSIVTIPTTGWTRSQQVHAFILN